MKESPIQLDRSFSGHSAKKFNCPSCGKKTFVRFFHFEKNEYMGDEYGRCDREENCGYFQSPFEDLKKDRLQKKQIDHGFKAQDPTSFVDKDMLMQTIDKYDRNNFFLFISSLIGEEEALRVFVKFYIGTAKNNGTIFWQIDEQMRARTGQKIHYGLDGKRIKTGPLSGAARLFKVEDGYQPCLFGLHQLRKAPMNAVIGMVESEKSAVICTIYMPQLPDGTPIIWMASSGSNGLTDEKIFPIRNRTVVLCPDYSYHARATWGLLPMKKKPVEKNIRQRDGSYQKKMVPVPHPDGELQRDYVSAKMRLEKFGVSVRFLDFHPELEDSSDIADHFLAAPVQPIYTRPNFSALKLPDEADTKNGVRVTLPEEEKKRGLDEIQETHFTIATMEFKSGTIFALKKDTEGNTQWQKTRHQEPRLPSKAQAEKILSNPLVKELINKFDLEPDRKLQSILEQ